MSSAMTISVSPQGGAYTRALKSEKSLAPLCPIGREAVITNGWCIMVLCQKTINKTCEQKVLPVVCILSLYVLCVLSAYGLV